MDTNFFLIGVTIQVELQIGSEASDVRFEGRHKPIHEGLTVAVRTTDTLSNRTSDASFLLTFTLLE